MLPSIVLAQNRHQFGGNIVDPGYQLGEGPLRCASLSMEATSRAVDRCADRPNPALRDLVELSWVAAVQATWRQGHEHSLGSLALTSSLISMGKAGLGSGEGYEPP